MRASSFLDRHFGGLLLSHSILIFVLIFATILLR